MVEGRDYKDLGGYCEDGKCDPLLCVRKTNNQRENKMILRKALFTAADKTVIRANVELPGNVLNPPQLLLFRKKLYRHSGSGFGGKEDNWVNFYREVPESFMIVQDDQCGIDTEFDST